ncbi:MAG: LytR/AlgR family response regulator transcription factor [Ignavibacteriaceae bacterium]
MTKKNLIIEDDSSIREVISEIFKFGGYEVLAASGGKKGIELARSFKPDLIICDLAMPEVDGFEVKRILNEDENTFNIPFICLTATADINVAQRIMQLGADDYITKPFSAKKLLELVSNRLERIDKLKRSKDEVPEKSKPVSGDEKILLKSNGEHILTSLNDIIIIKALDDNTEVFLKYGKKAIVNKSLKSWEEMLPEKNFLRVHRNTIINTRFIEKIEPMFKGSYVAKLMDYDEPIYFSQRYSQKVRKLFLMK